MAEAEQVWAEATGDEGFDDRETTGMV